jgi:hypothetical protein
MVKRAVPSPGLFDPKPAPRPVQQASAPPTPVELPPKPVPAPPAPPPQVDRNRCSCGAELEAIAPPVPLVWPYEGIELACPRCEPGGLELIDVVRGWYRRRGTTS